MNFIICFMVLCVWCCMIFGTVAQDKERDDNYEQFRSGQYNPYYNGQYLRNREIYNKRRYYENFYKKYKPDIEAKEASIVEQTSEPIQEDGSYSYMFETDNGIHNEAHGTAVTLNNGDQTQKVEGTFSYVTPEGVRVAVRYIADEKGYRPVITYDFINAKEFVRSQPVANSKT